MDWNMPLLDGIETTKKINTLCQQDKVPTIIMVSAFKQQSIINLAKDVGIDIFLQKPINPSILNNVLSETLLGNKAISFSEKIESSLKYDIQKLQGGKILLVEDNLINQEIIIGLLDHSGIKIDIANNGKEAITLFKANHYEVILMDLQMPIMDGYEATRIIRVEDKKLPIIALTANAMREDVAKTHAIGMNEHLNKPIDVEKLYKVLLKYLSKKTLEDDPIIHKEEREINLKETPSLNIEIGLFYFANNKKLYFKILKSFAKDYKNLNLDNLSTDDFKRATHSIKGLSANIGATTLNIISLELDESQNKALLPKFYNELTHVILEIEKIPHE
jgi:CheY-like chemotaxis protein/HPt (histidine-containing phosphotransfer) domain-containing protein